MEMKEKGICPITNKKFNCLKCSFDDGKDRCPYMDFDDLIQRTLVSLRKFVENEQRTK